MLSAITGYSVSKVEDEIRAFRNLDPDRKPVVRGTYTEEVAAALAHFGYGMELKDSFMHLARKERPSLSSWVTAQGRQGEAQDLFLLRARHSQEERGPLGADQGRPTCATPTRRGAGSSCAKAPTRARASWKCSRCARRSRYDCHPWA